MPTDTWGNALWDQILYINDYTAEGITHMERIFEFMKAQSNIEKEYSAALRRLLKTTMEEDPYCQKENMPSCRLLDRKSRLIKGWNLILNNLEERAVHHEEIASQIDGRILETVDYYIKNSGKDRKKYLTQIQFLDEELKKKYDELNKAKKKVETQSRLCEELKSTFTRVSEDVNTIKAHIDKAKKAQDDKISEVKELEEQYKVVLNETNELQEKHYKILLPTTLNEFQSYEEKRIDGIKDVYINYVGILNQIVVKESSTFKLLTEEFQSIDRKADIQAMIKIRKTSHEIPPLISVEDIPEKIRQENKKSRLGQIKLKLGINKKDSNSIEREILSLSGEKGIRKANNRIKEIDKQNEILEAKRNNSETLLNLYSNHPQLADVHTIEDIQQQKYKIEVAINTMRQKKWNLTRHIATLTEAPAPSEPEYYDVPITVDSSGCRSPNPYLTNALDASFKSSANIDSAKKEDVGSEGNIFSEHFSSSTPELPSANECPSSTKEGSQEH